MKGLSPEKGFPASRENPSSESLWRTSKNRGSPGKAEGATRKPGTKILED